MNQCHKRVSPAVFLRGGGAALVAPPTVIKRLRPRRCIARQLSVELADAIDDLRVRRPCCPR